LGTKFIATNACNKKKKDLKQQPKVNLKELEEGQKQTQS
jgi:hypothetical protein